jgi:hypothetical protein
MTHPRKGREERRDTFVRVRLTADELQLLKQHTNDAGLSLSDFLRNQTLGSKPVRSRKMPDRDILLALQAELGKIGSNLNQISRAMHRRVNSDSLSGWTLERIDPAMRSVKRLANALRKKLHGH